MQKCYKRMFELVRPLFVPYEQVTKHQLLHRLNVYFLLDKFEKIYQEDCNCSGYWSFFDFSDRFQRFAQSLCQEGYLMKVKNGTYRVIGY